MRPIINIIKKSFQFKGKTKRADYWKFMLSFFLILPLIGGVFYFINYSLYSGQFDSMVKFNEYYSQSIWNYLSVAVACLFIPSLYSATSRRLQDVGKSGWLGLFLMIPVLNFYAIYLLVQPSKK